MPILEECRDSDKIKVTYQTWTPGGIEFVFPTDGTEDDGSSNKGWTKRFIAGAKGVKIEKNEFGVTSFWIGRFTSQSNAFSTYENQRIFCGKTVFWIVRAPVGRRATDATLIKRKSRFSFQFSDGFIYNPISFILKSSIPRNDGSVNLDAPDWDEIIKTASLIESSDYTGVQHPQDSGCYATARRDRKQMVIATGSMQLLSAIVTQEYWKTIAILEDGREYEVTIRTTKPLSTELIKSKANEPVEVELTKDSKYFDFELIDSGAAIRFLRVNRFNGQKIQDLFIVSEHKAPNPTYSYSCSTEECPEGTWTLECGETTCCYNDQGYSTYQFPTP